MTLYLNNRIKTQFLNARAFRFGEDCIAPVLELVNHEVNAFPFIKNNNGISTPNYAPRESEVTHFYGYSGAVDRVLNYGFFSMTHTSFVHPFPAEMYIPLGKAKYIKIW